MRIILIEGDARSRTALHGRLQGEGFDVEAIGSPLEFYRSMATSSRDIAVVDADLAEGTGLDILSWLRGMGNIGIIALSAGNEARNRIACFESGADLHFTKPVDGEELVHGLRNLLRRLVHNEVERMAPVAPSDWWFFDTTHWMLQTPNGPSVKLSAVEAKFVRRLLIQTGAVVPRADLRAELGYEADPAGDKNLDAVIRRLRRKIESATGSPAPIQTVHGQGYLFSAQLRLERRRALEC
ncbi:MAG TPA: response regulator transcription factor [Sphingomonas sp.]